jgi:hypothetical protein
LPLSSTELQDNTNPHRLNFLALGGDLTVLTTVAYARLRGQPFTLPFKSRHIPTLLDDVNPDRNRK